METLSSVEVSKLLDLFTREGEYYHTRGRGYRALFNNGLVAVNPMGEHDRLTPKGIAHVRRILELEVEEVKDVIDEKIERLEKVSSWLRDNPPGDYAYAVNTREKEDLIVELLKDLKNGR